MGSEAGFLVVVVGGFWCFRFGFLFSRVVFFFFPHKASDISSSFTSLLGELRRRKGVLLE